MNSVHAEEYLSKKGVLIDTTSGNSMYPMLRHKKDTVTIVPIREPIKKYDVVLFKRNEQLVLHRVIKITSDGYQIRGDNCKDSELVKDSQLIGILSSFTRKRKQYSVNSKGYIIYSRLIVWLNPLIK